MVLEQTTTQTQAEAEVATNNAIARNILDYSASIYASSKTALPQFALSKIEQVEGVVVAQVNSYVDADALLNRVDENIDTAVEYGQNQVESLKAKVTDIKTQVDAVRTQAVDTVKDRVTNVKTQVDTVRTQAVDTVKAQIADVQGRVDAVQEAVTVSVKDTLESARTQATQKAVSGISKVLDISEAGLEMILPTVEGDEAAAEATESSTEVSEEAVFAPLVPRIHLLSQTVSKRVRKRVQDQLQGAPLKLRSNLEDIVHVNLLEYADNFMGQVSGHAGAVFQAANDAAGELKAVAARYQETVTDAVTNAVNTKVTPVLEKAAAPVEQSWARLRVELLRLQAAAREQQSQDSELAAEGDDKVMKQHEELVLSELALALRSVVLPSLVSWASAQLLNSYAVATSMVKSAATSAAETSEVEAKEVAEEAASASEE